MLLFDPQIISQRMQVPLAPGSDNEKVIKQIIATTGYEAACSFFYVRGFEKTNRTDLFKNPEISTGRVRGFGQSFFLSGVNVSNVEISTGNVPPNLSTYSGEFIVDSEKGYVDLVEEINDPFISITYNSGYDVDANGIAQNVPTYIVEIAVLYTLYTAYFQGALASEDSESRKKEVDFIRESISKFRSRVPYGKIKAIGWA